MLNQKALAASLSAVAANNYVEDVFSTWLYTGNDSTQTITNGIDLAGEGGLIWTKSRSNAIGHILYDTARGRTKGLFSNTTDSEQTYANDISSFNSNGYSIGNTSGYVNNAFTYASWTFRKAEKFFDVVTWTGDGSYPRNISHSLGSTPGMVIIKRTDASNSWVIWHRSFANTATDYLLFDTSAVASNANTWGSMTSTTIGIGSYSGQNVNGGTYVAYLFAHDAGGFGDSGSDSVVSCGSYTGNGSATGPVINLGWEPQWVMIKNTSTATDWIVADVMRGSVNTASGDDYMLLRPNLSDAEVATRGIRPSQTGFNITAAFGNVNTNGNTYIYIAIRRGPMKTPTDATKVFAPSISVGGFPSFVAGFPVDFNINGDRTGSDKMYAVSRLTGTGWMRTNTTAAEGTSASFKWDSQTGCISGWPPYIGWSFRRAPGFFDVVAYTGTNTAGQNAVPHNLGAVPELIIYKARTGATNVAWYVYSAGLGIDYYLLLNGSNAKTNFSLSNGVSPTSSNFYTTPGDSATSGTGYTFIAYLFASCPGVSKVGSYTGTGTTLNINCGFTAGARFVLIKRTDSTGSWYVWDTARGIVSGNDPYLLLNSTAAEVTNTDYIDPLSSGFQISSTAPAEINANGGSYIFLAVA